MLGDQTPEWPVTLPLKGLGSFRDVLDLKEKHSDINIRYTSDVLSYTKVWFARIHFDQSWRIIDSDSTRYGILKFQHATLYFFQFLRVFFSDDHRSIFRTVPMGTSQGRCGHHIGDLWSGQCHCGKWLFQLAEFGWSSSVTAGVRRCTVCVS